MRNAVVATVLTLMSSGALAQETLSREQALAEIARVMSEIEKENAGDLRPQSSWLYRFNFDSALRKATALKDRLASNPYVRVRGFSIGVPLGLTLEVEFKE